MATTLNALFDSKAILLMAIYIIVPSDSESNEDSIRQREPAINTLNFPTTDNKSKLER